MVPNGSLGHHRSTGAQVVHFQVGYACAEVYGAYQAGTSPGFIILA